MHKEGLKNAMPWLRQLVTWRPGFVPKSVHEGSVVDRVALGLSSLAFSVNIIIISLGAPCSYIMWAMNNMPAGGRSSET
jgi:hypothetical protein